MPLAAGQTLSCYELLGPLGAGAMGEVWRARDTRLGREVAIKVLPEPLATDEERLRRFEREARTLASVNHPNVAAIHGLERVEDVCFLVLELVPGEDLAERLARGPLPVPQALEVGRQIAAGLAAAHATHVVHRDLKPGNVRLTPDGTVKVLDFGLAKALPGGGEAPGPLSDGPAMTVEGLALGTPPYMSPEQVRGRPVDRRSDVWAFGCVLYECLTGERAFRGDTVPDLVASILHEEPDWRALPAATPAAVRELLQRTLAKDARERPDDLEEARLLLEREGAGARGAPEGRAARRPRAALLALGGLLAVTLTWSAYRLLGGEARARPAAARTSIAVLPFENLSGDPSTTPFVNGLHEDLITRLANLDGLTVISKGSAVLAAGAGLTVPEIADRLGVSTVLQASVQRSGSTVRITAHLIDGQTDENLWADAYVQDIDVAEVFDVQARLVERIANELAMRLDVRQRSAIRSVPTADFEAFEQYVRGRDAWIRLDEPSLRQALRHFEEAVDRDPSFALAYSAIADTYLGMEWVGVLPLDEAVPLARGSVQRALAIDPDLPEGRGALGHVFLHERRGPDAERELGRAVELRPSFLEARLFLATALLDWGRLDEAEESTRVALEVDPLSTFGTWGEGLVRLARDDYAGAAEHFRRGIEHDDSWVGHYELAWALEALGQREEACREIDRALAKSVGALALEFGLASTRVAFQAAAGDVDAARARLAALEGTAEPPFALGLAHAVLGDLDGAYELWLHRTEWTILLPAHFRYGPLCDGVRDDPRYGEVLATIDRQWGW